MLFRTAWQSLSQVFLTRYHTQAGMIALLHTWGQNLSLHPHLHCIVPGGGVDIYGKWKSLKRSGKGRSFLIPQKQIAAVFRGKFMQAVDQMQLMEKSLREALYKHKWIVHIQEPYAPPEAMLQYLARYTHKIALSNHRILDISEKAVSFSYLDYRDKHQKQMSLSGVEFLRRFSQHILPKRFVRVRYYGILSASRKQQYREILLQLGKVPVEKEDKDWKQVCRERLHFDPDICPCCGKGKMITIEAFPPGRGPPQYPRMKEK
jgi:hypothetical protein